MTRWPESIYDPLLDLPSIVNALGLILPDVLRSLLIAGTRLLIFSPQGVETRSAASIGWSLAEIVEAALTAADGGNEGEDDDAPPSARVQRLHQYIPQVRGIIGLHEISVLQDEEGRRKHAATMSGVRPKRGWIAWTTDKLYLDKADLYDCLLDLTPLVQGSSSSAIGAGQASTVLSAYDGSTKVGGCAPEFYRVERPDVSFASGHTRGSASKRPLPAKLKKQTWHTRDFSIYRDNELKAVAYESRPRRLGRRCSRGSLPSRSNTVDGDVRPLPGSAQGAGLGSQELSSRRRSPSTPVTGQLSRFLAILVDLVHYYLSTRAILPRPWRFHLHDRIRLGGESYGYVPLSIRPDGGVQAGLMLLPEDSESGSDSEGDDSDSDGEGAASKASTLRAGRLPLERAASQDGTQNPSPGLLQVHAASATSPAAHRRQERNPFSDLEDSDDDDDDQKYGSDMDSPPMRSPSSSRSGGGGADLDPILAACGASPSGHSSSRRTARSSFSGSSASGHSLNRRKSSSSRTGSRRGQGRERAWSDEVASAALTTSGQAGVPGPGLGPRGVKRAMLGTDRRQAQVDGSVDLNGSTATLTPASPAAGLDSAGGAGTAPGLDPSELTAPRLRSASGKQLKGSPKLVQAAGGAEGEGSGSAAQPFLSLDPRETCLARAIFAAWAEWVHELVEALETLRDPPPPLGPPAAHTAAGRARGGAGQRGVHRSLSDASVLSTTERPEVDAPPLSVEDQDLLPALTSREIYTVANLNMRFPADTALVRAWTGRELKVASGWRGWFGLG